MKSCIVALCIVFLSLNRISAFENFTVHNEPKINRIRKVVSRSSSDTKRDEWRNRTRNDTGIGLKTEFQRKWISQLFDDGERAFDMAAEVGHKCRQDFDLYKMHLKNQSIWAVRMLESSEWPYTGLFAGTLDFFGNWFECIQISAHGIDGQYCLVQAKYSVTKQLLNKTLTEAGKTDDKMDNDTAVWNAVEWYLENPVRVDRHKLKWAVCIPASCSNEDLRLSLNRTLHPIFEKNDLNIDITVEPRFCKTAKQENYPAGYYYASALFGILFSLVIGSSIYDILIGDGKDKVEDSVAMSVFRSFSAIKNMKNLAKFSPESDYIVLHFTKVVNIILVIYGHRFIYFIGYPKYSSEGVEQFYKASSLELIHTNVVDIFFCISGMLTFLCGYKMMKRGGVIYMVFSIIFRWMRMVPVFGLLMIFIINILPYANEGPLWDYKVLAEVDRCKSSWWASLLAINNIVKTDQQCLVISWYISTDFQLSIIGSILLLIAAKRFKLGVALTVATFLLSGAITFTVAYVNKYYGLLRLYMSLLEEPRNSDEFNYFYIATYLRAGPYLMGCFASLMAILLKDRHYRFTGKQTLFYSAVSIVIGEGSQYYGCVFYDHTRKYNRLESAIYAALNRCLFVFPYSVVLAIYFVSGLHWYQKLVERRVFVPLGRLTYCAFLVNTVLQLLHASAQKTVMPTTTRLNLFWWAFSDIVMSYLAGLLLHLLCEAPLKNMTKQLAGYLIGLALKKEGQTNSIPCDEKKSNRDDSSDLANNNNYKYEYHNRSFVNNEITAKVSESSKI